MALRREVYKLHAVKQAKCHMLFNNYALHCLRGFSWAERQLAIQNQTLTPEPIPGSVMVASSERHLGPGCSLWNIQKAANLSAGLEVNSAQPGNVVLPCRHPLAIICPIICIRKGMAIKGGEVPLQHPGILYLEARQCAVIPTADAVSCRASM